MLRFALCDDDPAALSSHRAMVEKYFSRRPDLAGELTIFSTPGDLLAAAGQRCFNIYLLDVLMPDENGIRLGSELRELDRNGVFIYLTSSPDFAVDAYAARAFHYLLKPIEQEQLFQALDEAVELISQRREETAVVRCKDGLRKLDVAQVIYVELSDKRLCCHLVSGEIVQSVSLREAFREAASEFLARPNFALCGVSYAVNLDHVMRVGQNQLHLRGEQTVPLSRSYRDEFTSRWLDHHLGGGA